MIFSIFFPDFNLNCFQAAVSRLNPTVSLIQMDGTSPADFRSPKRKRVASPENSPTKKGDNVFEEEDDGDVILLSIYFYVCT